MDDSEQPKSQLNLSKAPEFSGFFAPECVMCANTHPRDRERFKHNCTGVEYLENIMFEHTIDMSAFGSYAALQFQFIEGNGFLYPFLNFMAASLVLISLFENFNFPSLLIQISWIVISLYALSRMVFVKTSHPAPAE